MNRKWMSLLLVAMLLLPLVAMAFAEGVPSPDIGIVPPPQEATPSEPTNPDIGDEPSEPSEPSEPESALDGYVWPLDDDPGASGPPYALYLNPIDTEESEGEAVILPVVAALVTASDLDDAQVETSSASVSMSIGEGLISQAMADAADKLAEDPTQAVSEETLEALAEFAAVDAQNLGAVVSLPLAQIVVTPDPDEESATVVFDLSGLSLKAGEHTAGLITMLEDGSATSTAVQAQVSDGKVSVEIPADVLNEMALAQETMFTLLSD